MSEKSTNKYLKAFTLTLAIIIIAGVAGYFKLQDYSAQKVREVAARYSDIANIDFDRAMINPFDRSVKVWNVRCDFAVGGTCSAKVISVKKFDDSHRFPYFFEGEAQGVTVPVDFMNMGTLTRDFRKMGYDELSFDLSADYIYEDKAKQLSVHDLHFKGENFCELNIGFDLENVKLDRPGISGLIGVKVLDAGIIVHDDSLISRMIESSASSAKVSLDDYRKGVIEDLQLKMQKSRSTGNGYAENFYGELMKFIAKPEYFVLRFEPAKPVPLLYAFMGNSFENLLSLYGVTASSDPVIQGK
ncbi:hypothetical protein [Desulfovibrio gilichinskyi]|uniref:Uncharacterized protein n=1 Tax=Desulfovibrio gilichinskyi TaxID=1519643 RepID=A0A1X7EP56_9BACT|nr:hypothetical protein [Desulfovibrio gilichinskyi]SMF37503.1 hypothetical protein SAMN06295933_3238 [Desulfovibrio gilichinskyi]